MDIKELRKEINDIDDTLVELFEKRMEIARQVAEYKKENSLPVFDRAREREVISRLTEKVSPSLAPYTKALYNNVFDLSKTYQSTFLHPASNLIGKIQAAIENTDRLFPERAVIACQGIEGAYSQCACDKMFKYPSIMYVDTFESVFKAVDSGLCRYGILPLENSTAGSVNAVYSLMQRYKFHIVGSTKVCVGHALLGNPDASLMTVKEIFSHEQALNQCSDFLKKLPGVKITVCENTATAAKKVADSKSAEVAAICSPDCAQLYGLVRLESGIANTDNNHTRFICISKELEIYPGADRTSLMVRLPHKPGTLYGVISRFAALDVNLTKLESRPVAGSDFEFMFYFDVDASVYSHELCELIAQLEHDVDELIYLGSYNEFC